MLKLQTIFVWAVLVLFLSNFSYGQVRVQVRVSSLSVSNNCDLDAGLFGIGDTDSDFAWIFEGQDNTLGYQNHDPALLQSYNFAYLDNNNGPYTLSPPVSGVFNNNTSLFFDQSYFCFADVPTQINLTWEGFEYETTVVADYTINNGDAYTGGQNLSIPVPPIGTTTTMSSSASASCQVYNITFEITTLPIVQNYLEDNICDATEVAVGSGTTRFVWCPTGTLEPNEPHQGDVTNNKSAWLYFVAPASGRVEVTTDFGGTDFGTYMEIYHAADGPGCNAGIQPISGVLIKDKFEYLSWVDNADLGTNPLNNLLGNADINFDDCAGVFSSNPLVAGETYYVQLTTDDSNQRGFIDFAINDLGGTPAEPQDIPCRSIDITASAQSTTVTTNAAGSPVSANPAFGCATSRETGDAHTNNDPEEYFAYDYDHAAYNNGSVSESVWTQFIAGNNGRVYFEAGVETVLNTSDAENVALFGFDTRFSPGVPSDYSCADLVNISAAEGGIGGVLGGSETAILSQSCIEPGYTYYGMIDPEVTGNDIKVWAFDPSVDDPINNPPGNDILCLTMNDPLYEIVVTPAGMTPPFQAVAGNNERGCREYLAGEPAVHVDPTKRADQTVWHYFTVPPSGAIEMNLRAYIGMDTLRYSVYELLNGTDCYGGLNPATYTEDGTQSTPIITPVLQGAAGFEGTQESICCMDPGKLFAIQLDGGSPGDEGQYIIEYIREVESYAGDTYIELANSAIINVPSADTAFVCFNDSVAVGNALNGIGEPSLDIPSCLEAGFVLHDNNVLPDPVSGSGFTYNDTIRNEYGYFINDTDGSGSFGNPLFNSVYYVSSMADESSDWGDFNCNSSTVDNLIPIVFLEPTIPSYSYDNSLCQITFTSSGGLSTYYGSDFTYEIQDGSMNIVETGSFASGVNVVYQVISSEIYTITISDGACPYVFTVDASSCSNPCIVNPINEFVAVSICEGETIILEGAPQTTAGVYTDVFPASNGCDSTVVTTLTVNPQISYEQTVTICPGDSVVVGASVYYNEGVYIDNFPTATCDSVVTTNLFLHDQNNGAISASICSGSSYLFDGNVLTTSGTYTSSVLSSAVTGCDSTVTLYLNVGGSITTSSSIAICSGSTYNFGSQTLNSTGTYTESYVTASGCDSIATLYLTVNDPINTSSSVEICPGSSYTFGSQTISASGSYTEPFVTSNGCDSIVTLYVSYSPTLTSSLSQEICQGETFLFDGQPLTTSGTYIGNYSSSSGCDSTVTLYLFVNAALEGSSTATICSGQSFTFGSQVLSSTGSYTESFTTPSGCDSIATLYLLVDDAISSSLSDTICEGDTYIFGSQYLTIGGVYSEVFTSSQGCDSLVSLNLIVDPCSEELVISNICTPDGDLKNDTWKVSDLSLISGCTVQIFNRWGQLIFETNDYQNDWGGTKDGKQLPDGVYYYAIGCDDQREYQGAINLMRFKK